MKQQTLKSIQIGGLVVSETAEGNAVAVSINDQTTTLTRDDLSKLHETGKEFLSKKTFVKCGVCGHAMTGRLELSENAAIVTVEPCQSCDRKESTIHG